jgi:uncharacterized protein (UPF0297 family)
MNDIVEPRRGPGRPPKYHEITQATPVIEAVEVATLPQRPNRKPFGTLEQRLNYPARPGFHRHWFNEDRRDGGIPRVLEAGYEHVKDNEGKNVNKVVGTMVSGAPQIAYLMEIPEEWFKADMAEQQKQVDTKESAMRRGELESQEGDGRYVPAQGISIKHGR